MKIHTINKTSSAVLLGLVLCVLSGSVFGQNTFRKMNDFDGDGKADFAVVRRESGSVNWYIWQSRDGFKAFTWGQGGDPITPGDYDGDGKTDLAVWRKISGQGYFWIYGSQNGTVTVFPWGLSTDELVRGS